MKLADNLLVPNNTLRPDVVDALMRQPNTKETIPYSDQSIPGAVYMSDYDLGRNGIAYYDVDAANYQLSTGQWQTWNSVGPIETTEWTLRPINWQMGMVIM